jgi:DNA-binding protein H-NS
MAKVNLDKMSTEALISLRGDIDKALAGKRAALERQLAQISGNGNGSAHVASGNGRRSLKGRKVAPKYRGPNGELWAGRGMKPLWVKSALKKGKKLDSFLIK